MRCMPSAVSSMASAKRLILLAVIARSQHDELHHRELYIESCQSACKRGFDQDSAPRRRHRFELNGLITCPGLSISHKRGWPTSLWAICGGGSSGSSYAEVHLDPVTLISVPLESPEIGILSWNLAAASLLSERDTGML